MLPIEKVLSRVRWDKDFGNAAFLIGYYDRLAERLVHRPLADLVFPRDDRFAFLLMDDEGVWQRIPLHRVREVYRNGVLIWQRPDRA